jgi:hypothetical protein
MDYEPLLDPSNKYAIAYEQYKKDTNSFYNSFGNEIDDPSNEWKIDKWEKNKIEDLSVIFTSEFNALTDKEIYFFGCSFEIYQKTYNERLNAFLGAFFDTDEGVFIKQEFEKNIKYHTDEIIQKQIDYSLSLRNEFLNDKNVTLTTQLQQTEPELLNLSEISTVRFVNNFDKVTELNVFNYFKTNLLDKKYISETLFNDYLQLAFDKKVMPIQKFSFEKLNTQKAIINIFYNYYKTTAGKPYGKQKEYLNLLCNYFNGFENFNIKNFSK